METASEHRGHEQPVALPELSRALAGAPTTEAVAHVMAQAVPAIVDCDRVSIFLWDRRQDLLRCAAVTGVDEALVRGITLSAAEKRDLLDETAGARREARFYDRDSHDSSVSAFMDRVGSAALVAVPIVAAERLYGVLNVVATESPQRLRRTPALEERLASIVALAATAFDSARLIERETYEARHDRLTGLPGRRAFEEAIYERTRATSADRMFALASIAIDDFERINDEYGHPTGEEALRRVAEALSRSLRRDDAVFNVGGEEFAVLLPGLRSGDAHPVVERLRKAVAAVSFRCDLRASVGIASWPHDAFEAAGLLERAHAALGLAQRTGKNRTGWLAD